jgi:Domain of unknown function (DUF1707)
MMDRFTRVLAGLLGRSARLLPGTRRDWAEALLAEAGEIPARAGRAGWLAGGLWLVAREILTRVAPVLAFAAGAAVLVRFGWPGSSSDSAVPLNRMYVVVTVALLAVLPAVVRRYFGAARPGWGPRAARAGGYALVLALIAAKTVKDRLGSRLGAYFVVVPGIWVIEVLLLLIIASYVAGLLILTSQRVRLTRWTVPVAIGLGAVTGGVLYALAPFGVTIDPNGPSLSWWWLAAALPLATGFLAARLSARDTRPTTLGPILQGCVAASCATAAAALLLAALTSVTIALLPHHVPLQDSSYTSRGGCETCDPDRTVIPPGLRDEYLAEISVGQAGQTPLSALLVAPFLGAWLGVLGGALARRSPGTSGYSGPDGLAPPHPPGSLLASDDDLDQVLDTLTTAFAQGRLTSQELDRRTGQALAARTLAELTDVTADLPARMTRARPAPEPARARPRPPADQAATWSAWGLVTPALIAVVLAIGHLTAGSKAAEAILALVTLVYFIAWLVIGAEILLAWHRLRSPGGPLPMDQSPPVVGD